MNTKRHDQNRGGTAKNSSANSEIFVGRAGSPNLDIEIDKSVVSAKHLKIMKIGNLVVIEDLGSTNGTKIDGVPLIPGEQKPIYPNSKVLLADSELLDLNHPLIRGKFSDIGINSSTETVNSLTSSGTVKHGGGDSIASSSSGSPFTPTPKDRVKRFDRFYPPGYELEEESVCKGEKENIVIRVFSNENKLRAIVFGEESQNLIFNEERIFDSEIEDIPVSERRKFLKQEIQNFLYLCKDRYCKEEIWYHVLETEGKHKNGGSFKIISERFENRLRTKIYINSNLYKEQEEILEFDNDDLIKIRAQELHDELASQYKEPEKELEFPENIEWLNAIISKLPLYKKKPIYAFYFLLFIITFLFLIFTYISGGFAPKITSNNVDKKWIKQPYYAYIEEPIWGRLAEDCITGAENKWLKVDGKKKDNKLKKQCMEYCHTRVGILSKDVCQKIFPGKSFDSSTIPVQTQPYKIIPPTESIGSTSSDGTILFINNTNSDITIELDSIKVDGQDLPGIIVPIGGKTEFVLDAGEQGYRYDIMFEPTNIGQLEKGKYTVEVDFKVIQKGEEPHIKPVQFNLEI